MAFSGQKILQKSFLFQVDQGSITTVVNQPKHLLSGAPFFETDVSLPTEPATADFWFYFYVPRFIDWSTSEQNMIYYDNEHKLGKEVWVICWYLFSISVLPDVIFHGTKEKSGEC